MGGQASDGSPVADAGAGGGTPAPGGTTTTPAAPGTAAPSTGPASRVGEVARATLNAIDFPSFVDV